MIQPRQFLVITKQWALAVQSLWRAAVATVATVATVIQVATEAQVAMVVISGLQDSQWGDPEPI